MSSRFLEFALVAALLVILVGCESSTSGLDGPDADCAGVVGGAATTDSCEVCDADPNNDCVQDCGGIWGGNNTLDACNYCDDDPTNDCELP